MWRFNPRALAGRDDGDANHSHRPVCFNPRALAGRDCSSDIKMSVSFCFNPRARVGRDQKMDAAKQEVLVSIHAPAWGATSLFPYAPILSKCFNPRARVGRDYGKRKRFCNNKSFNPRARVGRDNGLTKTGYFVTVSIHAPAWGATIVL